MKIKKVKENGKLEHILVDSETRRKLKVKAALRDKTIGEIVKELIEIPYTPKSQPGEHNK